MKTFSSDAPIAIIGMGVMGTKVAWATARVGIPTRAYDIDLGRNRAAIERALSWSEGAEQAVVREHLVLSPTLGEALADVQLAFENVPEDADLKRSVLGELGRLLDPAAYLGSNTSSMLCSPLGLASGRPDRFFSLNFTDPRFMRLVELMGSAATAPETLAFARAWSAAIGMIPVHVKKEQMGYSFNRLWRVIKKEVLRQLALGYATPQDIDRAWMLTFQTPYGPCSLMDEIGLESVKKIEETYFNATGDPTDRPPPFLVDMVAAGKKGVSTGEGFYRYPDPEFQRKEFLVPPRE
jgi:3-hydroxyacyl-CoA dehydrogenase